MLLLLFVLTFKAKYKFVNNKICILGWLGLVVTLFTLVNISQSEFFLKANFCARLIYSVHVKYN